MKKLDSSLTEDSGGPVSESAGIPAAWLHLGTSVTPSVNDASLPTVETPVNHSNGCPLVPGYQLLEEVGRGGSGVVFRAMQMQPTRIVAVKMLIGQHLSEDVLVRFRQEADSLARLQHPGIVQIFEVGAANGQPFFSMEFCAGGNLAQRINNTPLSIHDAATIALQLADAMQKAHDANIIHRDLKPGNVMLVSPSNMPPAVSTVVTPTYRRLPLRRSDPATVNEQPPITKITDFGLAKHLDEDNTRTRSGAILGTPSYMAPEQADDTSTVTPAADVWSLGAILYEMLTGRPPFKGAALIDTLDQVRNRTPVSPASLNPLVPRDLDTICLKCLEKEPGKRYPSAAALADDLHRYMEGRPIKARPVGQVERLARWCRRHPSMAALWAFAILAVLTLVGGGIAYSHWLGMAEGDKRAAESDKRAAQEVARIARQQELAHRYQSRINAANEVIERRRLGWLRDATGLLDEASQIDTPERNPVQLRSLRTICLNGIDLLDPRPICPDMVPGAIAISAGDRPLIAVGQFRGIAFSPLVVQVADLKDGKIRATCKFVTLGVWRDGQVVPDGIQCLTFSPDANWLLIGTRVGNIYRCDLRQDAPEPVSLPARHDRSVNRMAFSADGNFVYSAGVEGKVLRIDVKAGWTQAGQFTSPQSVEDVAVLPGGRVVASTGGRLVFLDPSTLAEAAPSVAVPGAGMFSVRSDGAAVALEMGRQVGIVSLASEPALVRSLRDPFSDTLSEGRLGGVLYSPDRSLIVTTAHSEDDRRLKIWDAFNGRLLGTLVVPGSGPIAPTFSVDGKLLALVAGRKTILYRVERSELESEVAAGSRKVRAFDWSPDSTELAMVLCDDNRRGQFVISQVADGLVRHRLPVPNLPGNAIPNIVWSIQGDIAWNSEASQLVISQSRDRFLSQTGKNIQPRALAYDPDGRLWFAEKGSLFRWNGSPGDELPGKREFIWNNHLGDVFRGTVEIAELAAGRSQVLIATRDGGLYSLTNGVAPPTQLMMTNHDPLQCLAMSSDESLAVTGSRSGKLFIYDLKNRKLLQEIDAASDSLDALHISPDGSYFATGARDGTLKLWRWNGEAELLLAVPCPMPVHFLRFSPNGERLGILHSGESAVRVWNISLLKKRLDGYGLGW